MADLCPRADVRTPYGMTEALPVCDVTIDEIDAAGPGDGVLVGRPLEGVDVAISRIDADGVARGALSTTPGLLGSAVVRGLLARGDDVTVLQRTPAGHGSAVREILGDVTDPEAVRSALAGAQGVVHLAAVSYTHLTLPTSDLV